MQAKLVKKQDEASGTKSYFWELENKVSYLPGQYFYYTLPKLAFPDARGETRHFTASSSPTERDQLRLTTRVRKESGYKQTLDGLPIGAEITVEGPSGTFIIDEHMDAHLPAGRQVFLAGGIGITPFRSALKYKFDKHLDYPTILIYSNSKTEEIAFRQELEAWDGQLNFKLAMTVTKPEESNEKWSGLAGRIDAKMIKQHITDNLKPTFWVSGPPAFVDAMEGALGELKVEGDKIRSDKFTGY